MGQNTLEGKAPSPKLALVIGHDPTTGVMRHSDAGFSEALIDADEQKLDLMMISG